MAGDGTCLGVGGVVVGDDQSVHRVRILAAGHLLRPSVDAGLQVGVVWLGYLFPLHGLEAQLLQVAHALSPGVDVFVGVYQGEGYPVYMSPPYLFNIFQSQGARGQVAGIGVVASALQQEALEVLIGDDGLSAYHHVAFRCYPWQDALYGGSQVGDVGAYVSVTACHHLGQFPVVIGHHQRQAVQLP